MKKISIIIFAALAALTGCNRVLIEATGNGYFSFNLSAEGDFIDVQLSKAVANDDKNEFTVDINGAGDTYSKHFDRYGDMPSVLELPSGKYTLKVQSPSALPAAFDQPVYGAEKAFEVKVGESHTEKVVCTLQNVKVSLDPSESFLTELESYTISIANGSGVENVLYWTNVSSETESLYLTKDLSRSGYFAVAPLTVRIDGKRKSDGSTAYIEKLYQNVNPRDHYTISVDAKVAGSAGVELDVSTDVNPKDENIFIPSFDETPVPDDDEEQTPGDTGGDTGGDDSTGSGDQGGSDNQGGSGASPAGDMTMTWPGHESVNNVYPAVAIDGSPVALTISVPDKIAGFVVEINSEDAVFADAVKQMTTDGGTRLDLINDQTSIDALGPGGVGLDLDLAGKTEVVFNLTDLIPLIQLVAAQGTSHVFILEVTDQKNYSETWKLTFMNGASN